MITPYFNITNGLFLIYGQLWSARTDQFGTALFDRHDHTQINIKHTYTLLLLKPSLHPNDFSHFSFYYYYHYFYYYNTTMENGST